MIDAPAGSCHRDRYAMQRAEHLRSAVGRCPQLITSLGRDGPALRISRPSGAAVRATGHFVPACTSHLIAIGCGRVLLHAGERSAPLYARMGFTPTDELSASL
jgi:hypothetical protein